MQGYAACIRILRIYVYRHTHTQCLWHKNGNRNGKKKMNHEMDAGTVGIGFQAPISSRAVLIGRLLGDFRVRFEEEFRVRGLESRNPKP